MIEVILHETQEGPVWGKQTALQISERLQQGEIVTIQSYDNIESIECILRRDLRQLLYDFDPKTKCWQLKMY